MSKKRLFDDDDRWTDDALVLTQELAIAIRPILSKYLGLGFSVRDIAHIATITIFDLELEVMLPSSKESENGSAV